MTNCKNAFVGLVGARGSWIFGYLKDNFRKADRAIFASLIWSAL
jgi:hypothetical protein